MQSVMWSLPTGESVLVGHVMHSDPAVSFWYFPASQSTHAAEPLTGLYSPTSHAEHAVPFAPV
eukprot:3774818-Rhodomonas_salina.1